VPVLGNITELSVPLIVGAAGIRGIGVARWSPPKVSGDPAHLPTPAPCLARAFAGRSEPVVAQRAPVRRAAYSLVRALALSAHIDRGLQHRPNGTRAECHSTARRHHESCVDERRTGASFVGQLESRRCSPRGDMGRWGTSGGPKRLREAVPAIPAKPPALPAIQYVSTQRISGLAKWPGCAKMPVVQGILQPRRGFGDPPVNHRVESACRKKRQPMG
jgi:hypothetical protein